MDLSNTSLEGNYTKIREDPIVLLKFVDTHVTIRTIKNSAFTGFVHSIDPVSFSIIITVPKDDKHQTILLPGHAILDISEAEAGDTNTKLPLRKSTILETSLDTTRKEKLIKWLKWNLLPVTEDGDKIVFGNASILPPYTVMDICTDNPMVAIQMRKVLEKMPQDIESL